MTDQTKSTQEWAQALMAQIEGAATLDALEEARLAALGKKGALTERLKGLGGLAPDERKTVAAELNAIKDAVTARLAARKDELESSALAARLASERLDMTLPVGTGPQGRVHPIAQVMDEVIEIFAAMGFTLAEGPDIEDDFHNFTALNIPPEHPARQMHDTFYFPSRPGETEGRLLRTHTSPVQIRAMMAGPPPHRIIAPGRTYRVDYDQTHTPMFHQIEGLVIGRDIHMGHLRGVLEDFCKAFFELDRVAMRFRPSYFPFTEPGAEVDIQCRRSKDGIEIGAGDDWLEILGCGMVHPNVLQHCGIDPAEWQGFAWGMGIDRIAMLKYGIPDLRAFFDSDLRWLKHYGFVPLDIPRLGEGLSR